MRNYGHRLAVVRPEIDDSSWELIGYCTKCGIWTNGSMYEISNWWDSHLEHIRREVKHEGATHVRPR